MPAVFMLERKQLARWTWYQPEYPRCGTRPRVRKQAIRDGEPRLVGELILAGILEGV